MELEIGGIYKIPKQYRLYKLDGALNTHYMLVLSIDQDNIKLLYGNKFNFLDYNERKVGRSYGYFVTDHGCNQYYFPNKSFVVSKSKLIINDNSLIRSINNNQLEIINALLKMKLGDIMINIDNFPADKKMINDLIKCRDKIKSLEEQKDNLVQSILDHIKGDE